MPLVVSKNLHGIGKSITIIAMLILGVFFVYIGSLAITNPPKLQSIFMRKIHEIPSAELIPVIIIMFAVGIITVLHEISHHKERE